jgi:hypothetical protein
MLIVHGLDSMRVFISFFLLYEFAQHNLYNPIRTFQFVYKLKRTNSLVFVRIRIKSYNLYTNCIVRIHTKFLFLFFLSLCKQAASAQAARAKPVLRARSASRKHSARAARAKPELRAMARAASVQREPRGRSPSTSPAPTRPHPAAPTIRVHPAAPTN